MRHKRDGNADFAGVSTREGKLFLTLRARGGDAVVARGLLEQVTRRAARGEAR